MYLSKDIKKNILRLGEIRKFYKVSWDNEENYFSVADDKNQIHTFTENNQIYTSDFSSLSSPRNPLVLQTVFENKQKIPQGRLNELIS